LPGQPGRDQVSDLVLGGIWPGRHHRPRVLRCLKQPWDQAVLEYVQRGITIDAIAAAAGVGRQTIYRWWPAKGAVVAEAMARGARAIAPARDTGSFSGDLISFLTDSFAGLQDPGISRALRQLVR
jgi:AcrR family transcriptional regulator